MQNFMHDIRLCALHSAVISLFYDMTEGVPDAHRPDSFSVLYKPSDGVFELSVEYLKNGQVIGGEGF